ncbi:hypothetical protein P43SY_004971 [Pythium insidiosum]|uniref:YdbS-like PH domain-containing protein n=1 Tax=Pythium insidiosum TaxID=114742 RepID=A0AAD5Q9K3_PYTIN|nr:hypothetical protein P43SY_004971 [Pythium insidiosum]
MSNAYYQNPPLRQPVAIDQDGTYHIEFDRDGGFRYLCVAGSIPCVVCAPLSSVCSQKYIESQKCEVTDRRVIFESGWLNHSIKSIPLDRIQDVNIRQDCIQQCFGVKTLDIQTAGSGSPLAEASLIAPMDAVMVRDIILERRDALVLGHPEPTNLASQPVPTINATGAYSDIPTTTASSAVPSEANPTLVHELRTIQEALSRLVSHVSVDHKQDPRGPANSS